MCLSLGAGYVVTPPLSAQPSEPAAVDTTAVQPEVLDQLMAPIALYPDALVALILPAATSSSDVVLAARYLRGGGDPSQVDGQSWADSVKDLTHYPDVIKWMDENLEWTRQAGDAYLDHPDDVMAAIQRLRSRALANGVLVNTPQQQVVVENGYIRIIPAQQNVIYVPRYDPEIIFVDHPVYYPEEPWLTFGLGFGVGWWLSYDCDWGRRVIIVDHHRREHWRSEHDWRHPEFVRPGFVSRDPAWHSWRPAPGRPRSPHHDIVTGPRHEIARPAPLPGARIFERREQFGQQSRTSPDRSGAASRSQNSDTTRQFRPNHTFGPAHNAVSTPWSSQIRPQVTPQPELRQNNSERTRRYEPSSERRAERPERRAEPAPETRIERSPAMVSPRPMPAPTVSTPAPAMRQPVRTYAPVRQFQSQERGSVPANIPRPQPTSRAPAIGQDHVRQASPAPSQRTERSENSNNGGERKRDDRNR